MNKTKNINILFLCLIIWHVSNFLGLIDLIVLLNLNTTVTMIIIQLLLFLPIVVYLILEKVNITEWVPFQGIGIATVLQTVLLTFLIMPLVAFINLVSMTFSTNMVSESLGTMTENPFLVNLFMIAVLPAVLEEIVFRGIFYRAYREKGVVGAMILSSVTFGLMHMNFNQFCYAFVLGVIFCILVEATGSIFPAMIAHFVINGQSVVGLHSLPALESSASGMEEISSIADMPPGLVTLMIGIIGIVAVFATVLAALVLFWIVTTCGRKEHIRWCFRKKILPEGMSRNYFTVSLLLAMVVAIGYMVWIEI